jgi:hypothetical protein
VFIRVECQNTTYQSIYYTFKIQQIKMQTTAEYFCAFCGEENSTFIDISAGMLQSYIEDCQVCCHPNVLNITIDEDTFDVEISTDYQE